MINETPYLTTISEKSTGLNLPHFAYVTEEASLKKLFFALFNEISKITPDFEKTIMFISSVSDIQKCIEIIRYLPDLVMQHHGLTIDPYITNENDDYEMFNVCRKQYLNTSLWLEYYLVSSTKALKELFKLDDYQIKDYKYFAEMSAANLKLIQEICVFCKWRNFGRLSPERWWLAAEWELCEKALMDSGFIGEPIRIGKKDVYKNLRNLDKQTDFTNFDPNIFEIRCIDELSPLEAVEGLGWFIARNTLDKDFTPQFNTYKKTIKRCARGLRDSSLKIVYMKGLEYRKMLHGKRY